MARHQQTGNLAADVPGGAEGVRAAVLGEIYEVARVLHRPPSELAAPPRRAGWLPEGSPPEKQEAYRGG
ncbi:hypothetical protein CLOP_g56 [Closterium sp. NIES-67]|nr:hypothetical protein CLOP_g56 [Closterium sp. NIES-67]